MKTPITIISVYLLCALCVTVQELPAQRQITYLPSLSGLLVSTQDTGLPLTPIRPTLASKVPGLELSPPQTTIPGQRVAVVVAQSDGAVEWSVVGGVSANEVTGTKNLLVRFSGAPEVIVVTAHSVSGGAPTKTATTTITVPADKKSAAPSPPVFAPAAPPTPQKYGGHLHATFLLPDDKSPLAKEVMSAAFKAKLAAMDCEYHERLGLAKMEESYRDIAMELGKGKSATDGLPALVLLDDNDPANVLRQARIASAAEAIKMVEGVRK